MAVVAALMTAPDVEATAQKEPQSVPYILEAATPLRLKRARALAVDTQKEGILDLWLFANDLDEEVKAQALHSALVRCQHESLGVCAAMLHFFMDDGDSLLAWRARSALLVDDAQAALEAATRAYKLDVISLLATRITQPHAPKYAFVALRLLAQDPEPEIQEAANAVLLTIER